MERPRSASRLRPREDVATLVRPKSAITLRVKGQLWKVKSKARLVSKDRSSVGMLTDDEDLKAARLGFDRESQLQVSHAIENRKHEMQELVNAAARRYDERRRVVDKKEDALAKVRADYFLGPLNGFVWRDPCAALYAAAASDRVDTVRARAVLTLLR